MAKNIIVTLFICLAFCFTSFRAAAQDDKKDAKDRLTKLNIQKAEMTEEYKRNLQEVDKQAEEKTAKIKKDYRIAHDECLAERHNKSKELRKDYEAKLKPMIKEEEELVNFIGREAKEDFAKARPKKK